MSPYWRSVHISRSPVRNGPGDLNPVRGPRDAREAIGVALSGISAELAELEWRWPPRYSMDPATSRVGPGAMIPVEGGPRDWWDWGGVAGRLDPVMPVYVESRSDARA